ncbi:hypothetical protein F5B22DRAFT_653216 [Xylaria bambusicola]|uniref:uncharacterized protein n=1 Tax=Xylaria bambusicola TaxID=326684 RepID=UPI0020079FF1|nr:uncharacterized protein F5B22DRAFT_653216 [Xylaria bambusicola]KAI0528145.1 hypothetical protein F5B22DRAFT_653216 [Xylaria bambusicola]
MAHSTLTSRSNSPPADLRPAPLRIPHRKSIVSFDDDPEIAVIKYREEADDTSRSTSFQTNPSQSSRSSVPCKHSGPQCPRSRIESLVSRFEILDAVNNVNSSMPRYLAGSHQAKPSKIPQAIEPIRATQHDRMSHTPLESISRTSSESSLQVRTPSRSSCTTSTIPVLRHSRSLITSRKTPSRLPKSKAFQKKNSSFLQSSSTITLTSLQAAARPSPNRTDIRRQKPPQESTKGPDRHLDSNIVFPRQRPSFSQPDEPPRGIPKPSLNPKISESKLQDQNMPLFTSKYYPIPTLKRSSIDQDGGSCSHPPVFGKGHIIHIPSPQSTRGSMGNGEPSTSSSGNNQPSPHETTQEESNILNRPMKLAPWSRPRNNSAHQDVGYYASIDAAMEDLESIPLGELQLDGASAEVPRLQSDLSATEDTLVGTPSDVLATPTNLSQDFQSTHGGGKVSQLRRLFEKSSRRFPSPQPDECSDALMADYSSPSCNEPESPRSTRTISRRISIVPSLTTEISVNDFFYSPVPASPGETIAKISVSPKRDSPVKHRIRQFEHLSRESLRAEAVSGCQGKNSDIELSSTRRDGNGVSSKRVAIWRRISDSLSRSIDSWKDCNSLDHLDSARGFRYLSPFGYSMYRLPQKSRQFVTPSHTMSSIHYGDRGLPTSGSRRTINSSNRRQSPDTLTHRNSLSFAARVSNGQHLPSGFGLDGHFPSKPVQDDDSQPPDVASSGPSTPQGDPNALHKVMLKQSAAERSRRRDDEKHQRRDKTLRTLAAWKGKAKEVVLPQGADTANANEEAKKNRKCKGKEKEAPGKENETDKKTASGFVIFQSKDVKLRHPRPRRPGQVRRVANMYKDKASSGGSVNTKTSSGATLKGKEKESRASFRQRASSAFGRRGRKGDGSAS